MHTWTDGSHRELQNQPLGRHSHLHLRSKSASSPHSRGGTRPRPLREHLGTEPGSVQRPCSLRAPSLCWSRQWRGELPADTQCSQECRRDDASPLQAGAWTGVSLLPCPPGWSRSRVHLCVQGHASVWGCGATDDCQVWLQEDLYTGRGGQGQARGHQPPGRCLGARASA